MWRIKIQLQVKLSMNEDAFRGIPKLRLLVVLKYYLGVLWASPRLGSSTPYSIVHRIFTQNLKNPQHKTQQKTRKLRQYKKIKQPLRYCNELIINSYWCKSYCITTSLWFISLNTSHRCIKISKQHNENRICQKQNSLQ